MLVAALVSGYAAGSIALTAGLGTAWYFFLEPAFSFALPSQNEVASLLLFAVVGVVEIIVAEALRRGFDRETARERRSARAQEFGGVGDWEWDILSGRVTWSENLYRLMGRDPASFQPSPDNLVSVVHPDDTDRVTKVLQDAMATGDRFEVEMRGILPDGTVRHFVSRGDVLKDHAGKPSRLMVVKIDITERRQADDALAESEKRYRQLFNAMSEAYVVHDLVYDEAGNAVDFRAFEANPAFESHTGPAARHRGGSSGVRVRARRRRRVASVFCRRGAEGRAGSHRTLFGPASTMDRPAGFSARRSPLRDHLQRRDEAEAGGGRAGSRRSALGRRDAGGPGRRI